MSQISFKEVSKKDFIQKRKSLGNQYIHYEKYRIGCPTSDLEIFSNYILTDSYVNYFEQYEEYLKEKINKKLKKRCCSNNLERYFKFYRDENNGCCSNQEIINNCNDGFIEW